MSAHYSHQHLVSDTALEQRARGRNTATPCGADNKIRIVQQERAALADVADDEFSGMTDSGKLHCKAAGRLLGRRKTFKKYADARDALQIAHSMHGVGAMSEIVTSLLLHRGGASVTGRSQLTDLVANGRHVEVKSAYERPGKPKGHQVMINRKQLTQADVLMVSLISEPGARANTSNETHIEWIAAPMNFVHDYVKTHHPGQADKSDVVLPLWTTVARKAFAPYLFNGSANLMNELPRLLG